MPDKPIIYYADDDIDDLEIFKEASQTLNVEIRTFTNGKVLLDALQDSGEIPALIFVDLNMPVMDGYEVIKCIRAIEKFEHVPSVVLSTASDHISVVKSREAGANYFITKPTSIAKLLLAIAHTIRIDWNKFKPTYGEFIHKHDVDL